MRWVRNTNKKNRAQPDSCRRPGCPAAGHLAEPKGTVVDTFTDAKIDTRWKNLVNFEIFRRLAWEQQKQQKFKVFVHQ